MAFRSFQHFLEELERAGELLRITEPVDTELVIAEWANREMKSPGGGKALLFAKPTIDGKTSGFPVAINTMGSRKRIAMALGVNDVGDLAQEIQLILKAKPPTDLREGFALLKQGIHLLHARPKSVREGACQEVVQILDSDQTSNVKQPTASLFTTFPSSNAGRRTAGGSSLFPTCTRAIPKAARATSGCIGC